MTINIYKEAANRVKEIMESNSAPCWFQTEDLAVILEEFVGNRHFTFKDIMTKLKCEQATINATRVMLFIKCMNANIWGNNKSRHRCDALELLQDTDVRFLEVNTRKELIQSCNIVIGSYVHCDTGYAKQWHIQRARLEDTLDDQEPLFLTSEKIKAERVPHVLRCAKAISDVDARVLERLIQQDQDHRLFESFLLQVLSEKFRDVTVSVVNYNNTNNIGGYVRFVKGSLMVKKVVLIESRYNGGSR